MSEQGIPRHPQLKAGVDRYYGLSSVDSQRGVTRLDVCGDCGAVVGDREMHNEFHAVRTRLAPVVARPAPQTEGERDR